MSKAPTSSGSTTSSGSKAMAISLLRTDAASHELGSKRIMVFVPPEAPGSLSLGPFGHPPLERTPRDAQQLRGPGLVALHRIEHRQDVLLFQRVQVGGAF